MRRSVLAGCMLMMAVCACFGQTPQDLRLRIKNSQPDSSRIKLQLQLADYYIKSDDQSPAELDSAAALANKALLLAKSLRNANWENRALKRVGETFYQRNDTLRGLDCFSRLRNYYQNKGDHVSEARAWTAEGIVYPSTGIAAAAYRLKCYNNALSIFNKLNRPIEVGEVLQHIAEVHTGNATFDLAENELMQVLTSYKKLKYQELDHTYYLLSKIYSMNGNPNKEVFYLLEAIKNIQARGDMTDISKYYHSLSTAYTIIGKREEGLGLLRKAITSSKKFSVYMYTDMINELTALGRTKEALDTIDAVAKRPLPETPSGKQALFKALGFCYTKLDQNNKAEEYYIRMMAVDLSDLKRRDVFSYLSCYLSSNDAISFFYLNTHQPEKALKYINNMLTLYLSPPAAVHPIYRMNAYLGAFEVLQSAQRYREAINYYQAYKKLYDSVFNADKNRQLEEFKIKYETEKKEQAIKILQQRERQAILQNNIKQIELQKISLQRDVQTAELTQAELKRNMQETRLEQVILMRKAEMQRANYQQNTQAAEIQKVHMQRNITFAGIAMLIVIAGLAYNGYRHKRQSNILINKKNEALEGLLSEKNWLLKEVHHRVKNNLQIVMSLLSSQSAYLENNAAIEAIRESQNRVQAISLIHQKLYSSNNVASINMQTYVADLMSYLADSFDTRRRGIQIEQVIELFNLDIAQAVPLGLILNEAVTNAIKYAFDDEGGQIIIAAQLLSKGNLLLTITDNGKGLQDDFNLKAASSLGMEMMKALSKQLGGEFDVKNKAGVSISIEFAITHVIGGISTPVANEIH
jgi:two-component sensor histidine kinase